MTELELLTLKNTYAVEFGVDDQTAKDLILGHAPQLKPLPLLDAIQATKKVAAMDGLPRERGRHIAAIVAECQPRKFGSWVKDDDAGYQRELSLLRAAAPAWEKLKPKQREQWLDRCGLPAGAPRFQRIRAAKLAFARSLKPQPQTTETR